MWIEPDYVSLSILVCPWINNIIIFNIIIIIISSSIIFVFNIINIIPTITTIKVILFIIAIVISIIINLNLGWRGRGGSFTHPPAPPNVGFPLITQKR